MSSPQTHIRVLPDLRSKQVEEPYSSTPCDVISFGKNRDLGNTLLPEHFRQFNTASALIILLNSKETVLKIPEPLWLGFLPASSALILAWKLGGALSKRPRHVVTYAIENNDFSKLIGAATLYAPLLGKGQVFTAFFEELPTRLQRPGVAGMKLPFNKLGVIFVGYLEERHGVLTLLAAGSDVESSTPCAILTIVGDGSLELIVKSWCVLSSKSRVALARREHREISTIMNPTLCWQLRPPLGDDGGNKSAFQSSKDWKREPQS